MNTIAQRPISHKEELQMLGIALFSRVDRFNQSIDSNPDLIINMVCRDYHVSREELISTHRIRPLTQIRQVLMWYFHKELGMTQKDAASYFEGTRKDGAKDHSTTVHACRVMMNISNDKLIAYHFHRIMSVIQVDLDISHTGSLEDRIMTDLRILCGKQETTLTGQLIKRFVKSYGIDLDSFNNLLKRSHAINVVKFGINKGGAKTIQFI